MFLKVIFVQYFIFKCLINAEEILVTLPNGRLEGIRRDHYLAFEGIPYAKAPVGDLRFEPPHPFTEEWKGVRSAKEPGAKCMQWDHFEPGVNKLVGEEDCLFINVYTPRLDPVEKYPVVVYIHGGAFMFGHGHFYHGDHFLKRNFIFITINYRLGPLGFLSTESATVPGNMGMKDQVLAMKWVKQNIEHFGGDSNKITLAGFSAGGASVHLHLMSKMSKGLFQRAISHSGTALNPWVLADGLLRKTKSIAVAVGCTATKEESALIKCLKEKPASEIVHTVAKFMKFLYNPFSPFGVVVEVEHDGAFLTDKPINLLKTKKVHDIPWIASAVEMEGLYPAAEFYNELVISEINKNWNEFIPAILDYQYTIPENKLDTVSKKIRSHYMGKNTLTKATFESFARAVTDRLYLSDIGTAVQLHQLSTPVYFYFFTYKSAIGVGEILSHQNESLGVAHGEEILLLYKTELRQTDQIPYTKSEEKMIDAMLDVYETFSKTGVPKFGDTVLTQSSINSVGELEYNEIKSPSILTVERNCDFGDGNFWNSLGFDENRSDD